jgi:hypothetical protein
VPKFIGTAHFLTGLRRSRNLFQAVPHWITSSLKVEQGVGVPKLNLDDHTSSLLSFVMYTEAIGRQLLIILLNVFISFGL